MGTMTMAEKIRAYTVKAYINPTRAAHFPNAIFISGHIHKALNLKNRMPAVCSAIDAEIFRKENSLRLIKRVWLKHAATVQWIFEV